MGHCTVFSLKTVKKAFEKIFSLKFVQIGYKRPKSFFSNKYCDLLFHASFTKFTGPAMLFLNNDIFHFQQKYCEFLDFFWWWSLQRGQLNKSPCGCQKTLQNPKQKKLPNSIKLDPLSCPLIPVIYMKRYTRSVIFVTFRWKLSNFWIYLWKNFLEIYWRCLQNIVLQNPKKKKLPISPKYSPESFLFTRFIFMKRYTWSINFKTIHWQLIISWTYSEIDLIILLKTHFQGSSKRFAISNFFCMLNFIYF